MIHATVLLTAWLFGIRVAGSALAADYAVILADPVIPLDSAWTHMRFGEATKYRRLEIDRGTFIRAV